MLPLAVGADQILVACLLGAAFLLFVTELIPLGLTGLLIVVVLGFSGIVPPDKLFAESIAGTTVIIVGALYVVSAGLIRTGVVASVGARISGLGGRTEGRFVLVAMVSALLFSAILNNTAVVVLMIPILLGAAARMETPPSRLLMPVGFAAILGGTMTLIGTSTNVLVADLARKQAPGVTPLGFFEFLPMGTCYACVGVLYLWTFGRRLLPHRPTVSSITRGKAIEYVTELLVPDKGPAAGTRLGSLAASHEEVRILQLVRGEEVLDRLTDDLRLEAGDLLVVRAPVPSLLSMQSRLGFDALPGAREAGPPARGTTFAEIVITPASDLVGRTLSEAGLKRGYGVVAIALQRRKAHLRHGITTIPLRVGDTILVEGSPESVDGLRGRMDFLLLTGVDDHVRLRRRAPVAIGILAIFLALAGLTDLSLPLLAMSAAIAMVVSGCVSMRRAVREVDWNVLMLLAGSLALGIALHESKLAGRVADELLLATRSLGPRAVLSAVYLLTMVMTEFVSNNGTAALMVPIALAAANHIGVSPRPFLFAVAFGASASFSTPIGYQTNTFIFGPGGYRFSDYLRVGTPLQLLLWAFATIMLPVFFPF